MYASQIHILIGFEGEWMRPAYGPLVENLAVHPSVDYFIGSLHHVMGIPIDYDAEYYRKALHAAGATEEKMYERYYDEQFEMLRTLKPKVVGHFDLVRLMSSDPGRDVREWKGVWERIVRNLEFVAGYGGWLECNSSALRKGLDEPYPCRFIAQVGLPANFTVIFFVFSSLYNAILTPNRNGSGWAGSSPSPMTAMGSRR